MRAGGSAGERQSVGSGRWEEGLAREFLAIGKAWGTNGAACVGWGRGAGQGWPRERVAERLGEGRTSALEVPSWTDSGGPAGKPETVGPPPPQSSGAKRPTTFTTSGG